MGYSRSTDVKGLEVSYEVAKAKQIKESIQDFLNSFGRLGHKAIQLYENAPQGTDRGKLNIRILKPTRLKLFVWWRNHAAYGNTNSYLPCEKDVLQKPCRSTSHAE